MKTSPSKLSPCCRVSLTVSSSCFSILSLHLLTIPYQTPYQKSTSIERNEQLVKYISRIILSLPRLEHKRTSSTECIK